jgi:hypothetical protein
MYDRFRNCKLFLIYLTRLKDFIDYRDFIDEKTRGSGGMLQGILDIGDELY